MRPRAPEGAQLGQLSGPLDRGHLAPHARARAAPRSSRAPLPPVRADAGKAGKIGAAFEPADCRCLVRAVYGKQKISAMIAAKDHRRFMKSYGNILKVSLDSLKKKERIREKKTRAPRKP